MPPTIDGKLNRYKPIDSAKEYELKARKRIANWAKKQEPLTLDKSLYVELKSPFHEDPQLKTKVKYNALIYALGYGASFFDWLPLPATINKIIKEAIKWTAGRLGIDIREIKMPKL